MCESWQQLFSSYWGFLTMTDEQKNYMKLKKKYSYMRILLNRQWSLMLPYSTHFKWLEQKWIGGNYASITNPICRDLLKNLWPNHKMRGAALRMMMRPKTVGSDWLKAPCILAFDCVSTLAIWRTENLRLALVQTSCIGKSTRRRFSLFCIHYLSGR